MTLSIDKLSEHCHEILAVKTRQIGHHFHLSAHAKQRLSFTSHKHAKFSSDTHLLTLKLWATHTHMSRQQYTMIGSSFRCVSKNIPCQNFSKWQRQTPLHKNLLRVVSLLKKHYIVRVRTRFTAHNAETTRIYWNTNV